MESNICYKWLVFKPIKKLYDWVLGWAHTKYGVPAICVLAFVESSIFPIPPDPLLMALALSRPKKAMPYAFYCTIFSVLGGIVGYGIGYFLMESIGFKVLEIYGVMDKYETVKALYQQYDVWAVGIAGFTPLPYKIFTIAGGAFGINLPIFIVASAVSRGARYFIIAWLIQRYGEKIKVFIDKYFNLLTVAFAIMLVGGFFLLKVIL